MCWVFADLVTYIYTLFGKQCQETRNVPTAGHVWSQIANKPAQGKNGDYTVNRDHINSKETRVIMHQCIWRYFVGASYLH